MLVDEEGVTDELRWPDIGLRKVRRVYPYLRRERNSVLSIYYQSITTEIASSIILNYDARGPYLKYMNVHQNVSLTMTSRLLCNDDDVPITKLDSRRCLGVVLVLIHKSQGH